MDLKLTHQKASYELGKKSTWLVGERGARKLINYFCTLKTAEIFGTLEDSLNFYWAFYQTEAYYYVYLCFTSMRLPAYNFKSTSWDLASFLKQLQQLIT